MKISALLIALLVGMSGNIPAQAATKSHGSGRSTGHNKSSSRGHKKSHHKTASHSSQSRKS